MAAIGEGVATHVAESLVDKAMQELKYLCCYKTYVDGFEKEKTSLSARRGTVLENIEEANHRNENQVEKEVELWLGEAKNLIEEDTKGKEKWFRLVTNCFWQYKRGKELEEKKETIKRLMEQSNFARVARSTGLPGIEFYSSQNFMTFEDRELISQKLKEALKDDNKFMIGLYGLGGTGKTTMAIEVGKDVEKSKLFDKVIFSVVSKDTNLKNIRHNVAKHLNLPLTEGMDESQQAQELWKRIAEGGKKVLIILDDMWKELILRDIGIPLGRHGKGCCAVLLTTRNLRVCIDMGCNERIQLEVLKEKDAVDLFLYYAGMSIDGPSNDFKDVALGIVKECGSLPVAIVAVASALKSRPLPEWQDSLKRLQNHEGIHDVDEDLKQAYNSLRLSYDNLRNEKAQKLFLLCSLFPEDYDIPIELLTRIAIGLGLCGEANKYSVARSHFTPIKNALIDSCLLLKAEKECVKMHDLVREVALWIGNKQVQVAMASNTTLMENIQYSSWNITDLPNHFEGRNLEVLLVWINNANSLQVKVPNNIFEEMVNLKVLALTSSSTLEISATSLFQPPLSLANIRTLSIKKFKSLGDISILANLKNLESLELNKCSIIELPKEIEECQKLRLLEMVGCSFMGRNNPFEVIGNCSQLEELYYVSNRVDGYCGQITTLPTLQKYHIKGWDGSDFNEVDFSLSRYFNSQLLRVDFSNEIFKLLVARAEVLRLGGDYDNRGWANIVPDILSVEDDNMKDQLTRLSLHSMNEIKYQIHTENLRPSVAIFSKLVALTLYSVDVRELCHGPYPVYFLKQLKELHLSGCEKLEGTLFDGKLELCNLKSIDLYECSMTCLFHASTAQSLKQLEKLDIIKCLKLKYIAAETMDDQDPNQKSHDSMLPKLKYLRIDRCAELEFILPICFCEDLPQLESMQIASCEKLKYVFGQYPKHRDLHRMGKEAILQLLEVLEIEGVPNFINIYAECYLPRPCSDEVQESSPSAKADSSSSLSRGHLCCFWTKSKASTIRHTSAPMDTQSNHSQALKVKYVVNRAHGLSTPPLYPCRSLRRIKIIGFSELKSLFTPSIGSSLKLLEWLIVSNCDALEHIVTDEEHGHDRGNVNSIFPNLREVHVYGCSHLEYIFPAFYSKDFKHLEFVEITEAGMLTHVFGECRADENLNVQADINLPALKRLDLEDLPNMVGICAKNYDVKELYLEDIRLNECPALKTLMDLLVDGHKRQEDLSRRKALPLEKKGKPPSNTQELPKLEDIGVEPIIYMSFQNLSELTIQGCKHLKFILCASTSRWLQKLKRLWVSECEELVSIMEDEENHKNPMTLHQVCFPELRVITVKRCKSLKCLFPMSCGKLPRLWHVDIEDAPQLGQVFGWKQGEGQKLVIENVLPKLIAIRLVNLPNLHTICQGIDFHAVKIRHVHPCPAAISLTSTYDGSSDELAELLSQTLSNEDYYDYEDDSAFCGFAEWESMRVEASMVIKGAFIVSLKSPENTNASTSGIVVEKLSTTPSSASDMDERESEWAEASEVIEGDSIVSPKSPESANTSGNEIVEEKPSTTLSTNSDVNTKVSTNEIVEEQVPASNTAATPPSKSDRDNLVYNVNSTTHSELTISNLGTSVFIKELCEKEPMCDQQALGESRSSHEAHQRVEEPTNKCPSKETTNEMALTIPEAITGMNPPLISSICSPKKPQNETSAAHVKMKSGSSAITDQSAQIANASANEIVKENLFTTPSSNSDMNLKATFREGPSLEKYDKVSSSTYSKPKIGKPSTLDSSKELCGKEMGDQQALGESRSSNEAPQQIEEPTNECSSKETSKKMALWIPPFVTGMTSPPISLISSPNKPQVAASTTHIETESGSSAVTDQSAQGQIMLNQKETSIDDDLIRLLRIMKDGSDLEVDLPSISKLAALEDDKVAKAFLDIESSLKMDLHQIANSEEHTNRLENALKFLSAHFSEEEPSSHGLIRGKIDSLHQEIQRILSSFKRASNNLDTFTKLKEKEKRIDEQHSQRMEEATTLVSEIYKTEDYMIKLKEHITRLQAELKSKEEEFEDCEIKLSSLQKQKKECVLDTVGFMEEYEAVKKDKSCVVDSQTKATQELKKAENEWPSCVAELRKTALLLGILLQQKL